MTKRGKSPPHPYPVKRQKKSKPHEKKGAAEGEQLQSCGVSSQARSTHKKMEVRAMIRDKIPGPTRVGDNGLMLQAVETIRELEMYNARAADQLESLQNLQSCNASIDYHRKQKLSVHDQHTCGTSVPEGSDLMALGQKPDEGCTKLNAVLPGHSNLKGTRLFVHALEYMTNLEDEKAKLDAKIAEREKIEINAPIPPQSTHWTSEASDPEPCVQIIGLRGLGAATPSVGEKTKGIFQD